MSLLSVLDTYDSFALFGHGYIDGDALWSIIGLWWVLEKKGKKVSYFTSTPVPEYLQIIQWRQKVSTEFDYGDYGCCVFCDFTPSDRLGSLSDTPEKKAYFDNAKLVIIDHHLGDCDVSFDKIYKDVTATSNAEWIRENIKDDVIVGETFTAQEATALYLWLTTDSWNFKHDTWSRTLRNAYELVDAGADKKHIIDALYKSQSLQKVMFVQDIVSRLSITDGVLYSEFDETHLEQFGAAREDGKTALSLLCSIKDIDLVILNKRIAGQCQLSLRSHDKVDCSDLAAQYGGWGHKNAAWCRVESELTGEEIVTMMREAMAR